MSTGTTFGEKLGWGASGTLTTGDTLKTLTLQAQFPETGTFTVEFTRGSNPASNNPIFCEATIFWSVEGIFCSRRITIADGVAISGVGQAVKVIIKDNTVALLPPTNPFFAPVNAVDYGVSLQVSFGGRGTDGQPPFLVPVMSDGGTQPAGPFSFNRDGLFSVSPGKNVTIAIPTDAGIKSVFITGRVNETPVPQRGFLLASQDFNGTPLKSYDPRTFTEWVPINPGADHIVLSASASNKQDVDFSVTFGVEG